MGTKYSNHIMSLFRLKLESMYGQRANRWLGKFFEMEVEKNPHDICIRPQVQHCILPLNLDISYNLRFLQRFLLKNIFRR